MPNQHPLRFSADLGTSVGGSTTKSIPSSWLSIASGTPIAGWVIGCVIASEITRRLGRRMTVVVICIIAIVGITIQAAVNNYWAIMAGRLVNSISMGIEANCIPMYMSELSVRQNPPGWLEGHGELSADYSYSRNSRPQSVEQWSTSTNGGS